MMHFETTCHVSHVTCQVQHVTFQQFPNLKSYGPENFLIMFTTPYHVSCLPCHLSGVTFHLSLVRCHMSGVICHNFFSFFFTKLWSWFVQGLLSMGPTHKVSHKSTFVQSVQLAAECKHNASGQKHYIYILPLAVETVQMNWICRLGRYLMAYPVQFLEFL